jgi:hypothetical protein
VEDMDMLEVEDINMLEEHDHPSNHRLWETGMNMVEVKDMDMV